MWGISPDFTLYFHGNDPLVMCFHGCDPLCVCFLGNDPCVTTDTVFTCIRLIIYMFPSGLLLVWFRGYDSLCVCFYRNDPLVMFFPCILLNIYIYIYMFPWKFLLYYELLDSDSPEPIERSGKKLQYNFNFRQ
jgi:hypothetical protein